MSVSRAITDVVTNGAGEADLGWVTAPAALFAQVKIRGDGPERYAIGFTCQRATTVGK